MATQVPPKNAATFITYIGLASQANPLIFQANPTLAAGDVKVSIDGGTFNNLTTLPTVTPAAGKAVKVTVSAAEMTGDNIQVVFSDAAGAEWCDTLLNIQPVARQIDDLAFPATSGRSTLVNSTGGVAPDWGQVQNPTTTVGLSGTTFSVTQVIASVSGAVASVTGAVGSVAGNVVGSVGSVLGNVAGNVVGSVGSVLGNVVGSVASVLGNVAGNLLGGVGGNVIGSVGSLAAQAKADVNAEVVDALNVDTYAEPTGVPASTTTLVGKIGRLYAALRNGVTVNSALGKKQFLDDANAAAWEKDVSDDGTTYTETKGNAP